MVFKKDKDPYSTESYRPISLLSAFSKIYERIVLDRLLDIDTFNDALPNHQFGFRSRHSAIEQVHRVVNYTLDATCYQFPDDYNVPKYALLLCE